MPAPDARSPSPATPASASGFTPALPGYRFQFPRDGGAHSGSKTEWWYYTGHLHSNGGDYGFELTFFRVGLEPHPHPRASHWATSVLYLAHFAITDKRTNAFHYGERTDRGALGFAGADVNRENVWLGNWYARVVPGTSVEPRLWPHQVQASSEFGSLNLTLTPVKAPVIQGRNGVSKKGPAINNASHYYSYTRLDARGSLTIGGKKRSVTGLVWMDHEFASDQLAANETGWDWFSIQLSDGWDVMLYQLRLGAAGGQGGPESISPFSSGSLVSPDGQSRFITREAFSAMSRGQWKSPHSGAIYPSTWDVQVPSAGLDLHLTPAVADQELAAGQSGGVTYWEGAMQVIGTHSGHPVTGQGYTELTGYGNALAELR